MRVKHHIPSTEPSTLRVIRLLLSALCVLVISSCVASTTPPAPTATATKQISKTPTLPPTLTPSPTIFSPEPPFSAWFEADFPHHLVERITQYEFLSLAKTKSEAVLTFSTNPGQEAGAWIYLAAAPFYSVWEDISSTALISCWTDGPQDELPFRRIFITSQSKEIVELLWGAANDICVQEVSSADLSETLWIDAESIAIIPFEAAEPALKILPIDGHDPLSSDFERTAYPLFLPLYYQVPEGIEVALPATELITNLDPARLTSIALTGVTALVRDTANIMEIQGITYPAGDIQNILTEVDITHINNEVPFAADCPTPEPDQVSLRFCSDDRYLALLEAVGADIVELSGDHFGDWGPDAMLHTIDLYQQQGWLIYGGGINLSEGLAPAFISHNGNQFAFIGCNGKKIDRYATATEEDPGAAQCDFKWMIPEITRLANSGYIVIATMQHEEVDSFGSIAIQQYDFRRLADAGAVIVSGSQSHHPQAFEYDGTSFIHYGLGNLFFDQWYLSQYNPKQHLNKDKSFIDLHYFYNGNYIGTRLIALQFIDNARPRPMTTEEKIPFLSEVYQSSLWNGEWVHLYSSGYMRNRIEQ